MSSTPPKVLTHEDILRLCDPYNQDWDELIREDAQNGKVDDFEIICNAKCGDEILPWSELPKPGN